MKNLLPRRRYSLIPPAPTPFPSFPYPAVSINDSHGFSLSLCLKPRISRGEKSSQFNVFQLIQQGNSRFAMHRKFLCMNKCSRGSIESFVAGSCFPSDYRLSYFPKTYNFTLYKIELGTVISPQVVR